MTKITLDVGCHGKRFDGEGVLIVGMVPKETIEFERGYRYFDHTERLYNEHGIDPYRPDSIFNIEEILTEGSNIGFVETAKRHYSNLDTPVLEFIPKDVPRFHLNVNRHYINKFGFITKITKKIFDHYEDSCRYYDKVGKTGSSIASGFDLVARVKL